MLSNWPSTLTITLTLTPNPQPEGVRPYLFSDSHGRRRVLARVRSFQFCGSHREWGPISWCAQFTGFSHLSSETVP